MKMFGKLKNILFEEETVEIPVITEEKKEEKQEVQEEVETVSRFKNYNYEEPKVEKETHTEPKMEMNKPKIDEVKQSPFQQFDEEEFDRLAALNKSRLLERDRKLREEKLKEEREAQARNQFREYQNQYNNRVELNKQVSSVNSSTQNDTHKFKPSPVISPVYGILNKNYKKEDIISKKDQEESNIAMDVDSVRKRAFGALEDIEKNAIVRETKITSFDDEIEIPDEPIIVDNSHGAKDIEPEEVQAIENEPKEEIPDIKIDDDEENTLESDLFNLIDSMYQDKEDN